MSTPIQPTELLVGAKGNLGYVGLWLEPPGLTGLMGAAVVPIWYAWGKAAEAEVVGGGWYWARGCVVFSKLTVQGPAEPAHCVAL